MRAYLKGTHGGKHSGQENHGTGLIGNAKVGISGWFRFLVGELSSLNRQSSVRRNPIEMCRYRLSLVAFPSHDDLKRRGYANDDDKYVTGARVSFSFLGRILYCLFFILL